MHVLHPAAVVTGAKYDTRSLTTGDIGIEYEEVIYTSSRSWSTEECDVLFGGAVDVEIRNGKSTAVVDAAIVNRRLVTGTGIPVHRIAGINVSGLSEILATEATGTPFGDPAQISEIGDEVGIRSGTRTRRHFDRGEGGGRTFRAVRSNGGGGKGREDDKR